MEELLKVKDLKMVDVRKYDGVCDGMESWTFLGYDIVRLDNEGKAISVLAEEETKYEVLKSAYVEKYKREVIDHSEIKEGTVMVKEVDSEQLQRSFLGSDSMMTSDALKARLDQQPNFYFLHYNRENAIVKKIGKK